MGSARINAVRQRLGVKKGLPKPGTPESDDLIDKLTKKIMGIEKKKPLACTNLGDMVYWPPL